MITVAKRKTYKSGGSRYVTLPEYWIKSAGISDNTEIAIAVNNDGSLNLSIAENEEN